MSKGTGEKENRRIGAFHLEGQHQSDVWSLDPLGAQGQPPGVQRVRRVRSKTGKARSLLVYRFLSLYSTRF